MRTISCPRILKNINLQHNRGARVVQGYIDSKNPNDSWISYSYSIAFWTVNKLFQQSRYNLGLGCQLCGTGFSVDVSVLREIGWGATCLTEDMEFTMKLGLNDIKVSWANDAVVYDEKASYHVTVVETARALDAGSCGRCMQILRQAG